MNVLLINNVGKIVNYPHKNPSSKFMRDYYIRVILSEIYILPLLLQYIIFKNKIILVGR